VCRVCESLFDGDRGDLAGWSLPTAFLHGLLMTGWRIECEVLGAACQEEARAAPRRFTSPHIHATIQRAESAEKERARVAREMGEQSGVTVAQLVPLSVEKQACPDGAPRGGADGNLDRPSRAALGILPDGSGD
jgi:hypothetical protein